MPITTLVSRGLNAAQQRTSLMLGRRMSSRMKQLVFVCTTLGVLRDVKHDEAIIAELNGTLRLARHQGLFREMISLKSVVWRSADQASIVAQAAVRGEVTSDGFSVPRASRQELMDYFIQHAPVWLRYGELDGSDMRRDLTRLFNAMDNVQTDGLVTA